MEEKPMFKTVQEVVEAGEELKRYLHAVGEPLNAPVPVMDIPAIDFSLLLSSSEAGREELRKLHWALSKWGVVQVMNHGISEEFLDEIYKLTKQFFALPNEEKQKYARETGNVQGYGNDMILVENQVLDWIDRLFLTTYPEDQRQLRFWPELPIGFREMVHEYTMKQRPIVEQIFKAMARSLELEENCFIEMHGTMTETRFNIYPPCPRPEVVTGVKPHSDGSAFTLLLPDKNVEGLQFLKDGKWFKPPIAPDTILINVGDLMEIMSNGIFKSPVHRVVTNREKERVSVATFLFPGPDSEIQPVEGLISETRPRLYKTVKKYVELYFDTYQQGGRPIEAALISGSYLVSPVDDKK